MEKKVWFIRKRYGWGWMPITWQGWLILAIYVGVLVKSFLVVDMYSHSNSDTLIGFALPFILLSSVLIGICYWKGEKPKWQWGREETEERT